MGSGIGKNQNWENQSQSNDDDDDMGFKVAVYRFIECLYKSKGIENQVTKWMRKLAVISDIQCHKSYKYHIYNGTVQWSVYNIHVHVYYTSGTEMFMVRFPAARYPNL